MKKDNEASRRVRELRAKMQERGLTEEEEELDRALAQAEANKYAKMEYPEAHDRILKLLKEGRNTSQIATILGTSRNSVYRKIDKIRYLAEKKGDQKKLDALSKCWKPEKQGSFPPGGNPRSTRSQTPVQPGPESPFNLSPASPGSHGATPGSNPPAEAAGASDPGLEEKPGFLRQAGIGSEDTQGNSNPGLPRTTSFIQVGNGISHPVQTTIKRLTDEGVFDNEKIMRQTEELKRYRKLFPEYQNENTLLALDETNTVLGILYTRVEPAENTAGGISLYADKIWIRDGYRRRGIATTLLRTLAQNALSQIPAEVRDKKPLPIYLCGVTRNDEATQGLAASLGFKKERDVPTDTSFNYRVDASMIAGEAGTSLPRAEPLEGAIDQKNMQYQPVETAV